MGLFVRHNTDIVLQAGLVKGYLACSYRLLKVKRFMAVLNPKGFSELLPVCLLAFSHLILVISQSTLSFQKGFFFSGGR